jgi:hypothetical protein
VYSIGIGFSFTIRAKDVILAIFATRILYVYTVQQPAVTVEAYRAVSVTAIPEAVVAFEAVGSLIVHQ